MGMCKSKAASAMVGTGGGPMDQLKNMAFSMMVNQGMGSQNNSQFAILKNLVGTNFPKANIQQNVSDTVSPNAFNVLMGGQELYNAERQGPLTEPRNQATFMDSLKNVLMSQATGLVR